MEQLRDGLFMALRPHGLKVQVYSGSESFLVAPPGGSIIAVADVSGLISQSPSVR